MCFIPNNDSEIAKVAKKDIRCWKVIRTDGKPLYHYQSKISYKMANREKPRVMLRFSEGAIFRGYHSYRRRGYALDGFTPFLHSDMQVIKKFIIPAGTRYYENETEYVSETIMRVK